MCMQVLVWMLLQAWQAAASPLLLSCKTIEVLQAWKGGRHVGPGWLLLLLLQQCCPWLHLRTITLFSSQACWAVLPCPVRQQKARSLTIHRRRRACPATVLPRAWCSV